MLAAQGDAGRAAAHAERYSAEHDDQAHRDPGDGPAPLAVLTLLRPVPDKPHTEHHQQDADDQPRRRPRIRGSVAG